MMWKNIPLIRCENFVINKYSQYFERIHEYATLFSKYVLKGADDDDDNKFRYNIILIERIRINSV
jgi:hypothetical protein